MRRKGDQLSIFARRLGQARKVAGMTQRELAEQLYLHRSTYAYYETGVSEPRFDTLRRMCAALNVSADWLIGVNEEEVDKQCDTN